MDGKQKFFILFLSFVVSIMAVVSVSAAEQSKEEKIARAM